MLLPLSLILRSPPRTATGAARRSGHGGGRVLGWPASAVVAMLCLAIVGCCVAMAMPMVHLIAYATDLGHPSARAAEMLAALLAGAVVSRLLFGALADRIGGLWTLLIGSAGQLLMLSSFTFVESLVGLYVIAALFGLVYGGIVPCYAIIVRELFPIRQVGSRIGIVFLFGTIGMALGGWLGGQIFDLTGSYHSAFLVGVVFNLGNLALVGALLLRQGWRVPRPRGCLITAPRSRGDAVPPRLPSREEESRMPDFTVLSFNHTAFTVSDLDEVIPFFRDLLGFELTSRAPRDRRLIRRMTAIDGVDLEIAYVNGPGHRIELIEYKAPADREVVVPRLCDSGAAHVALNVAGHRGPGRSVRGLWLHRGRRDHRDRRRTEQGQQGRVPARPGRDHGRVPRAGGVILRMAPARTPPPAILPALALRYPASRTMPAGVSWRFGPRHAPLVPRLSRDGDRGRDRLLVPAGQRPARA